MRKSFFSFFFILALTYTLGQNTSPVVSNVNFTYDGSQVTVTYDVSDTEQSTVTIDMKVSTDGGTNWDYNYGTATGDIGSDISTGTGKTITFAFSDNNANMKIRIIAYDETAGGTGCGNVYYEGGPNEDNGDDNYYYTTIVIGNKCWLRENINKSTSVTRYCYDDNSVNCNTFGGLYDWSTATTICPEGWRLPTKADFEDLVSYIRNANDLKKEGDNSGTDVSGFRGMFGGYRSSIDDKSYGINDYAYFWTNTVDADGDASDGDVTVFRLFTGDNYEFNDNFAQSHAASVRCVKDVSK